jgi:serine/threonine-protein kinase
MPKPLVISVSEAREGGASHVFVFDRFPVVFGRDPGANLIIDRGVVSALHGVFDVDSAGTMTYSDLGARNGTLLNRRPVPVDDPIAIRETDVLSVGDLRMRILSEAPERPAGRPPRNPFAAPSSNPSDGVPRETEIASADDGWHAPEELVAAPEHDAPVMLDRSPSLPPLPLVEEPAPGFRPPAAAPPSLAPEFRRPNTVTAPPDENDGLARALPRPVTPQGSPGGRRSPGRGFFQPGEKLANGRYEILSFIGAGGMSAVYRANDFNLKDTVAIKMLTPELSARADALERFEREGRSARRIRSPNVVEIYDFGNEDGTPYIVMELLPGEPLSALISRGPLTVSRALRIILDVCNGVIAAHDEGIVHRDLKPDNIFLVSKGSGDPLAKVLDFGISKTADSRLTQLGTIIGTRNYQSPEQATGSPHLDARSDEFALAVILYECLTQRTPHEGANAMVVTRNVLEGRFKKPREIRPDIPEELERAILRAMELSPADRFPSVREFGNVIRPFAPPDAQALFMRLSSDIHQRSGAIVEVAPAKFAGRPGGTELLPESRPSGRPIPTKVLPESSRGGSGSMDARDPASSGASRERAAPVRAKLPHRRPWIIGIAAATVVIGGALIGTAVMRTPSNHASDNAGARPVTAPIPPQEPPAPEVVTPPPRPKAVMPPPVVAQPEQVEPPPQHQKKHAHHATKEAAPSTPHKVGDVWVIPSQSGNQ